MFRSFEKINKCFKERILGKENLPYMSLIHRVGWVWTLEKNVTNSEGRVGLDPNMYDVTLFTFFFEVFPNLEILY